MIPILHPEHVQWVFFDAVGTLILPRPPVAEVYAHIGQRYGSRLMPDEIEGRFRAAFRRQEEIDHVGQQRTSEERELRRWQEIVREVFMDVADTSAAFAELWRHFAQSTSWKCYDDVEPCLEALNRLGLRLGIASNFDRRLHGIAAGLSPLPRCEALAISSEVGWRKPAPEFFAALIKQAGCPAEEIVLVGDDWENDIVGGQQAGLQTVFLDRRGITQHKDLIRSLTELATGLFT